MDTILRDRLSMIAALGAGVVVGLSGIYLYYKANRCVTRELTQLSGTIDTLRKEIEELKAAARAAEAKQSGSPEKKKSIVLPACGRHFTSYPSSIEDAEEEYFDFTDTEEAIGTWASLNGPVVNSSDASTSESWLDEIDEFLDSSTYDKESLYYMMIEKKEQNLDNVEFLWRLAKATHLYGIMVQNRGEVEKKKDLVFEASSYAKMALELSKNHAEVHKWCAITIGSVGDYVGTQERIMNGYTFKEHVDQALSLKPLDPSLHYMLGRWCYEVAMLSWIERKLASALFSSPPEATLEEAREHLMEADKLKSDWKENLLFLAKTYIGEGDYTNAISIIDKAIALPVDCDADELAHKELETLQYKYQTYRLE